MHRSIDTDIISTPRRELAPAIEEDEEPESESQGKGPAPLRQIENNISAILRGEVSIARVPGRLFFDNFKHVRLQGVLAPPVVLARPRPHSSAREFFP